MLQVKLKLVSQLKRLDTRLNRGLVQTIKIKIKTLQSKPLLFVDLDFFQWLVLENNYDGKT